MNQMLMSKGVHETTSCYEDSDDERNENISTLQSDRHEKVQAERISEIKLFRDIERITSSASDEESEIRLRHNFEELDGSIQGQTIPLRNNYTS